MSSSRSAMAAWGILAAAVALGCGGSSGGGGPGADTLSTIELAPASATLIPTGSQDFTVACKDDTGSALACPTLAWSATGGTVNQSGNTSGTYTAGATTGTFAVQVTGGSVTGTAPVTVVSPGAPPNVTVSTSQRFQTIKGWEATLNGDTYSKNYSAALNQHLVDSAAAFGITRIRLEAAGNIIESLDRSMPFENRVATNDNNDPNVVNPAGFWWVLMDYQIQNWVLPLKARVEANGGTFMLNVNYVGFKSSEDFQQTLPGAPAEYAEFVVTVLHHIKDTWGLEPDIWEARLEPDVGFTITGTQEGQMIAAAAARARAEGFNKVMFAAPSNTTANSVITWLNGVTAVPNVSQYLAEVTYHRYGTQPSLTTLHNIRDAAAALGAGTGMLEHIGADIHQLYQDLAEADNIAWQQFVLEGTSPDDGTHYFIVNQAAGTFQLSSTARYLRQFFGFVRPGDVRVGATTTLGGVEPVAFQAPGGGVTLVANVSSARTLAVGGLPAGTYLTTFTTAGQTMATGAPITIAAGQTLSTTIPAAGTITIHP
ncbi:MAG TPA: hypothetical protein VNH46_02570 [Gemmatimonadales bacterium]|nr:hypothetical protein [Gemmatimonadales bacterium]